VWSLYISQAVRGEGKRRVCVQKEREEGDVEDAIAPTRVLLLCDKVIVCASATVYQHVTEYQT